MELKIISGKGKEFVRALNAVSNLVTDFNLVMTDDGISINHIDPSNVAFVSMTVPKGFFGEYAVNGPETVGVSASLFTKSVARCVGDDIIIRTSADKVIISSGQRKFEIPVIDVESAKNVPNLDETRFSVVKVATETVQSAVSDIMTLLGKDNGSMGLEYDGTNIVARFGESGKGYEHKMVPVTQSGAKNGSSFATDYMEKVIVKEYDEVTLRIGTEYPLDARYGSDADITQIKLRFIIAPRVANE